MRTSLRYLVASALLAACGGSDDPSEPDAAQDVEGDAPQSADGAMDVDPPSGDTGTDTVAVDTGLDTEVAQPGEDVADTREDEDGLVSDADPPDVVQVDADAADADLLDASDAADDVVDDAVDADDGDVVGVETGSIAGTVHLALTAQTVPLMGATVRAGGLTTTTDADGRFLLSGVESSVRVRVDVSVDGPDTFYSSSSRMVGVAVDGLTKVRFELAEGCAATVDVSSGPGVVLPGDCGSLGGLAGIELPINGVVDEAGTPVSTVRVVMVPLPLQGAQAASGDAMLVFPGDMRAETGSGEEVTLESRGAIEVRLSEPGTGRPLQLAAGETATIMFPAMADSLNDETLGSPLWWYDEDFGVWLEFSGASTTIEVEPFGDRLLHRAEVPHFTWWNADMPMTRTCITGRLVDGEGAPLVARSVSAIGVDYLGATWATSGPDGRFLVPARRSSNAVVSASVEIGAASVAVRRFVSTRADETTCADVGDLVLDTTSIAACASGRVLDVDGSTPVSGAEVVAANGRQVLRTVSADDGTFCLPVPSGEGYEVVTTVRSGEGERIGRLDGLEGVAGSGFCAPAGEGCAALGDVVLRAPACLRGTVADAAGVVSGAVVETIGRRGSSFAVSEADGGWCVQMEQDEIVRVVGRLRDFLGRTTLRGEDVNVNMPPSAGDCGNPASCQVINLILDERSCVSGTVTGDDGTTLGGARITVTRADGGTPVVLFADDDGDFCAPVAAGQEVRIDVLWFGAGVRYVGSQLVDIAAGPASCALDTCVDAGTIEAVGISSSTCVRGRLLDEAPLPFRDTATLLFGSGAVGIRQERSGDFCVDIPASASITIRDDEDRGCIRPREEDFDISDATPGSCADPTGCVDIGDLDFDDFCFSS